MALDFEQKQIVVEGLLLNFYFYKPQGISKEKLIFLHGWRSDSSVWLKFLDSNKFKNYEIYLIDQPGYGKSEIPKQPFDLEKYAKIVYRFIKELKIEKPIIIGHSFGGAVLIKLASMYPDILKSMVLIGASGIRKKEIKKTLFKIIAKSISPFFKPKFMHGLRMSLYRMIGSDDYVAAPHLKETYLNIIKEDLTEDLKKIKNNTLLIWGEKDKDTPLEDGLLMSKNIKNSKLNIIKGAGHFSFITDSDLVADYIINFINQNV